MKSFLSKILLQVLLVAVAVFSSRADALATNPPSQKRVLFICTGNYYRSRFAELFFNEKAREAHLDWKAASRGLGLVPWQHGISPWARRELIKRGVPLQWCKGEPHSLTQEDLEKSDYIVLMDETEHRPMLEKEFPACDKGKLHYWHIADSGKMSAAKACHLMSLQIEELFRLAVH